MHVRTQKHIHISTQQALHAHRKTNKHAYKHVHACKHTCSQPCTTQRVGPHIGMLLCCACLMAVTRIHNRCHVLNQSVGALLQGVLPSFEGWNHLLAAQWTQLGSVGAVHAAVRLHDVEGLWTNAACVLTPVMLPCNDLVTGTPLCRMMRNHVSAA